MIERALHVARSLLRDPLMYTALRARPEAHRTPLGALADLGFDAGEVAAFGPDYEQAAAELYPQLAFRWERDIGATPLLAKLREPGTPQNASNELVYLAVRTLRPQTVVETGTFGGILSTFILRALEDNGTGRLFSLDLAAHEPISRSIDIALPHARGPGWLIPDGLLSRFELVLGDARETLPPLLAELGQIDVFVCDSLQTFRHMTFEYRSAWSALSPGGLLCSNNAFVTPAFWWFTRRRRVPFLFVGGDFGVTRASR